MKKIIPLFLVAFIMITGQIVNAQTPNESAGAKASCCKKGDKEDKCMQGIPDLTDQQKQKIEDLCLSTKKEMTGLKNQMGEKQAHLKTLQDADKADMAAINKTIDEISVLKADMMKKHEATRQSIRELLTEKQRIVFDAKPMDCCGGGEKGEMHGAPGAGGCCKGGTHKCGGK